MVYTIKLPAPASISTNDEISPAPDVGISTEAFPVASVVHVTFDNSDGNISATVAPTTSVGPSFVTVNV